MKNIYSLNYLVNNLKNILTKDTAVIKAFDLFSQYNSNDWKYYKPNYKYNFNRQLIYGDNIFELYLLSWYNYKSNWHYHSNNGCMLKILEGQYYEYNIKNNIPHLNILYDNMISYNNFNDRHKIIVYNYAHGLHLYSPGIKKIYNRL